MYVQYHSRCDSTPALAYLSLQNLLSLLDALLFLHDVRSRPGLLSTRVLEHLLVFALLCAESCERLVLLLDSPGMLLEGVLDVVELEQDAAENELVL